MLLQDPQLDPIIQKLDAIVATGVNQQNLQDAVDLLFLFSGLIRLNKDGQQIFLEKASTLLPVFFQTLIEKYQQLPNTHSKLILLLYDAVYYNKAAATNLLANCLKYGTQQVYQNSSAQDLTLLILIFKESFIEFSPELVAQAFYLQNTYFAQEKQSDRFHYATVNDYINTISQLSNLSNRQTDFIKAAQKIEKFLSEKITPLSYKESDLKIIRNNIYQSVQKKFLQQLNTMLPKFPMSGIFLKESLQFWQLTLVNQCSDAHTFDMLFNQLPNEVIRDFGKKHQALFTAIFANGYYITPESLKKQRIFLRLIGNDTPEAYLQLCPSGTSEVTRLPFNAELAEVFFTIFAIYNRKAKPLNSSWPKDFYQHMSDKLIQYIKDSDMALIEKIKPTFIKMLKLESKDRKLTILLDLFEASCYVDKQKFFFDMVMSELSQLTTEQKMLLAKLFQGQDRNAVELASFLLKYYNEGVSLYQEPYFIYQQDYAGYEYKETLCNRSDKISPRQKTFKKIIELANLRKNPEIDFLILSFSGHAFYSTANLGYLLKSFEKANLTSDEVVFYKRIQSYFNSDNELLSEDELNKIKIYFLSCYKAKLFYEIGQLEGVKSVGAVREDDFSFFFYDKYLFDTGIYCAGEDRGSKNTPFKSKISKQFSWLIKEIQSSKDLPALITAVEQYDKSWFSLQITRDANEATVKESLIKVKEEIDNIIKRSNEIEDFRKKIIAKKSLSNVEQENNNNPIKPPLAQDLTLTGEGESSIKLYPTLSACQTKMDESEVAETEIKQASVMDVNLALNELASGQVDYRPCAPAQSEPVQVMGDCDSVKLKDKNNIRVKLWLELSQKIAELVKLNGKDHLDIMDSLLSGYRNQAASKIIFDEFYDYNLSDCPFIIEGIVCEDGITRDKASVEYYFKTQKYTEYPSTNITYTGRFLSSVSIHEIIEETLTKLIKETEKQINDYQQQKTFGNSQLLIDFSLFEQIKAEPEEKSSDLILQLSELPVVNDAPKVEATEAQLQALVAITVPAQRKEKKQEQAEALRL